MRTTNITHIGMVKKRFTAFILTITAITALFTGCASEPDREGGRFSDKEPVADGSAFTEETAIYVSDVDTAKSRVVYDMKDDIYSGIFDSCQPFDTDRYYFCLNKDNNTKYGINFTGTLDENYQQTVLCSKADCTHIDESCPAYIDLVGGYFTLNGKLYFYSPYLYDYSMDPLAGEGTRIRLFSVDGSGKQLFSEIIGYTQTSGTVITDGTNIYFTAQQEKDKNIYIMKINMQTGNAEILRQIPVRLDLSDYRLCDITADGNQLIFTARDSKNTEDSVVGVYSIRDNKFAIIQILPADEYRIPTEKGNIEIYTLVGNSLYVMDNTTGCLTRQRLGNEEKEILFDDLKAVTGNPHHITMSYAYDNKMVLTCFAGSKHKLSTAKYFVLDTQTLEVTPLNITARNTMSIVSLIRIFSATPNYFVVATDITNYSATANKMAFISKADFYANNPQFIPIGIIGS